MSQYQDGAHRTFEAGADLSAEANLYRIVKLSSGKVVKAADPADEQIGVLYNRPANGGNADVRLRNASGTTLVKLGGTVAAGAYVASDANGDGITATTDSGDQAIGFALAAGVVGDIIEVMLSPRRY